ncbi:hypothetical protein [Magnetococcus sp. PR-3]|uniref:hypothetical protein n=1 Tax=Magnetococcus sp. PR-3 TaxID=3120355 RepID=UPI002FCE0B2B
MESVDVDIMTHSETLDHWLSPYEKLIGPDFAGYRGHIYRVLNHTLWFLKGDQRYRAEIEFALVHHDIGLWTDQDLAYLEPSIAQALKVNEAQGLGFEKDLIHNLIFYHHKITAYKGGHAELVNALRCADWVDASRGKIRHGMERDWIARVNDAIPAHGFYETLARVGPELTGGKKLKMLGKVMQVFKW